MNKDNFIAAVKAAGIVGEGGAGFPAHVKYAASADTVIANGCECEPLLHTDQHIMAHDPSSFLRGLAALKEAVGANRGVVGIKKKHVELIRTLQGIAPGMGLEIFPLDDFYPAGDEQTLVYEITGRSVPPLGIPLAVNTVVANVGSLANVDAALGNNGPARPVTHKILTVTGDVAKPSVIRVPVGMPLTECLAACGGATIADPVFILGGPMMGRVVQNLAPEVVTKTTGGLIVIPSGHHLHKNAKQDVKGMRRRAAAACIQCRMCSDLCPRYLIGHPFETHRVMRAFGSGLEIDSQAAHVAVMCCECGICEHFSCPMMLSPRRINMAVKAALRNKNIQYQGSREIVPDNTTWQSVRKLPVKRLAARIGIEKYMKLETPFMGDITTNEVSIPLRQHIGAAAVAVVKVGDTVRCGDLIGEAPEGALGARVHASIDGVVEEVTHRVRIRVR